MKYLIILLILALLATTAASVTVPTRASTPVLIIGSYDSFDPYGVGVNQNWSKMNYMVAGYGCYVKSPSDPSLVYTINAPERNIAHQAGLKYLLDFGGQTNLTAIMNNSNYRSTLVSNLASLVNSGGFDGLQIDWEDYSGKISQPVYHYFLVSLRSALGTGKIIMPCVPGDLSYGWVNTTDLDLVDGLVLMCYGGPGGAQLGTSYAKFVNTIKPWLNAGYNPARLFAGIPFYSDDAEDMFGSYYQVIDKFHPPTNLNILTTSTADGFAGNKINVRGGKLYFNGADLAVSKCLWCIANGIGGVYLWNVNWDASPGSPHSLLDAVYYAVNPSAMPTPDSIPAPAPIPPPTPALTATSTPNSTFTPTPSPSHTINISSPCWDVNGDHKCDAADMVMIVMHWQQRGSAGWIPEDLNADGKVDFLDVVNIGMHWIQTW
jgi:hypothetical protein